MKRVFFLVMLLVCYAGRSWGVVYDTVLKKQLDSIIAEDQRYRPFIALQPGRVMDSLVKAIGIPSDQINDHYARLQDKIDSTNLALVKAIFAKVGYPGSSLVGAPANEVCFYVIQHSAKIDQYFPLIRKAGKKHELPYNLVAMMQDRNLKNKGKKQIYGTQFAGTMVKDPVTKEQRIEWFLWPVKCYARVDKRRKRAGFNSSIAEYAADLGMPPKKITLRQVRKKFPWMVPSKKHKPG